MCKPLIIKPKYTSTYLNELYFGKNTTVEMHTANVKLFLLSLAFVILWITWVIIFIDSTMYSNYMSWINSLFKMYMSFCENKLGQWMMYVSLFVELFGVLIKIILILAPSILLPSKIMDLIFGKVRRYYIKKGLIHSSPILYRDYNDLSRIYNNIEQILPLLELKDSIKILVDGSEHIILISDNVVISKEHRYYFGIFTEEIFTNHKIDFSIVDDYLDTLLTEDNSKIFPRSYHRKEE